MNDEKALEISSYEFDILRHYAQTQTGINLQTHKKEKLFNFIIKKLSKYELTDIDSYISFLKINQNENAKFINFLTNVTTDFFRERHHFELLNTVVKDLIIQKNKIRIWSAGCASGEEPYSIAMTIFESLPFPLHYDIKILATDINTEALESAKLGLYHASKIEKLDFHKKWFHVVSKDDKINLYQIDSNIRNVIRFKYLNLVEEFPMHHHFDIIFFRNVGIYMSKDILKSIFLKLDRLLTINGLLILGHAESLENTLREKYLPLGKNIYRKILIE